LWLLHWNLATHDKGVLFAWRLLINHWPYPELSRSEAIAAFIRESHRLGYSHSVVTLSQHLDVFLHTYVASRGPGTGVEDSLDGPLVNLEVLQKVGERKTKEGRWEPVYMFRREEKPEINAALFSYCLADFWRRFRPSEDTLSIRDVALDVCSPGQTFKLSEEDVRARLETYARPGGPFSYQPSAVQGLLSRRRRANAICLSDVYEQEPAIA
jgi:hypothetical protein